MTLIPTALNDVLMQLGGLFVGYMIGGYLLEGYRMMVIRRKRMERRYARGIDL